MDVFQKRLQVCATKSGGISTLAEKSGVSRVQLRRYLNGTSNPTLDKIYAIASASGVKPGWLVDEDQRDKKFISQVVLDKDVFLEVVEKVEATIQNQNRVFSPRRKALVIFALTKEAEKAQTTQKDFLLSNQSIMEMFDFISVFPDDHVVEDLFKAIERLPDETDPEKVKRWVDLICRAHAQSCDTLSGRLYFDRMPEVSGKYAMQLDWVLAKAEAMAGEVKSFLDLGCGNGRHLKYIHNKHPDIMLKGIDASQYAIQLAQNREAKGEMPVGTFQRGDMRHLPYKNNSFDVIMARLSLFCFPLSPNGVGGLNQVVAEAARVLKPGGMFYALSRRGKGISFYCLEQLIDESDIKVLAKQAGLEVWGVKPLDLNKTLHDKSPQNVMHESVNDIISFQLMKPLKRY